MDEEISGIEDDEGGIGDDVEVDGDGAGEVAGGEVWFEAYVVAFRNSEFGEARLPFELLHKLKQKQMSNCNQNYGYTATNSYGS